MKSGQNQQSNLKEQVDMLAAKFGLTDEAKAAVLELSRKSYVKGSDAAWEILKKTEQPKKRKICKKN